MPPLSTCQSLRVLAVPTLAPTLTLTLTLTLTRSFGLIMLEMLLGKFPYPHQENYFRLLSLIMDEEVCAQTPCMGTALALHEHCMGTALHGRCIPDRVLHGRRRRACPRAPSRTSSPSLSACA